MSAEMLWMSGGIYNQIDFCEAHDTLYCTFGTKILGGNLALHPTVPQFPIYALVPLFPGAQGEPLQTFPSLP